MSKPQIEPEVTELPIEVMNNDTFDGLTITVEADFALPNLIDAKMQVRKDRDTVPVIDLSVGNGITILNAVTREFQVDEQVFSAEPGDYLYDIQTTFSNGIETFIKTYIKGTFTILGDITHE